MRSRLLPILALVMLAALPAAAHTRTLSEPNGVLQPHLSSDVEIEPEIALLPIIADAPDTLPVFTRSRKLASGFFGLRAEPNIQRTLDLGQESRQADDSMHARYYNPNLGRFLSVDPVLDMGRAMRKPQGWNRYAYVENNPMNSTDPTGKVIDTIADIGFIAYDIFDIGRSLSRGQGVSGTQGLALGADILGAVIPFATGGGAAVRVAAHTDDVVDTVKAIDKTADGARGAVGGKRAGKPHTQAAKRKAREVAGPDCPKCGTTMTEPTGRTKGSTVDPAEAQGDHIIPKSKSGDGATVKDQRNIEVICASCNNKKRDRIE